jgi:hypothetical protein
MAPADGETFTSRLESHSESRLATEAPPSGRPEIARRLEDIDFAPGNGVASAFSGAPVVNRRKSERRHTAECSRDAQGGRSLLKNDKPAAGAAASGGCGFIIARRASKARRAGDRGYGDRQAETDIRPPVWRRGPRT